jgi:hypothetical protein
VIDRKRIGELMVQQAEVGTAARERFQARGIDYDDVLGGLIAHGLSPEHATLVMTGIDIGYLCALEVLNEKEPARG